LPEAAPASPKSVRDIVATEPIWDRSELPREELTARIIAAGRRIDHAYALSAMTFADGQISLDNGVHRWAVAVDLGIKRVPVEMIFQPPEPTWGWTAAWAANDPSAPEPALPLATQNPASTSTDATTMPITQLASL
jgi:hypothetical protein